MPFTDEMIEGTARPRCRRPAFLAACLTMLLVGGTVTAVVIVRDLAELTSPAVLIGEDARSRIEESGVDLPESASDLYYAFTPQFADYHDIFISFSASAGDCTEAAQAYGLRATSTPVFVEGTRSQYDWVTGGPGYHHPELITPLWDLTTVTKGRMLEMRRLFILVDTENNRVYISTRSK